MNKEILECDIKIRISRQMYQDCMMFAENHSLPISTYVRMLLKGALDHQTHIHINFEETSKCRKKKKELKKSV